MDNLQYNLALNRVRFQKNFITKLFYVLIFNAIYAVYLYTAKHLIYNDKSIKFLIFSAAFLLFHVLKYAVLAMLLRLFPDRIFSKKENLFATHFSLFWALLALKLLIDSNRPYLTLSQEMAYQDYALWFIFIVVHYFWVFSPEPKFLKQWEDRKIKELMQNEMNKNHD